MKAIQACLYAGWGIGKTSLLGEHAKYLWTEKGLKTLVFSSDTGGDGPLEEGKAAGAIHCFYTDIYQNSQFVLMNKIVKGYRPPEQGAPLKDWKLIKSFSEEGYGALWIEGLTSWGSAMLRWAATQQASGQAIGQMDKDSKLNFKDGDDVIGLNNPVHYGIAQQELEKKVSEAKALWLRGLPFIGWTALEEKAELKGKANTSFESKPFAYGPKMPGQAATAQCGSWFTDVLHLDVVNPKKQEDGTILGERRLFLQPHYAPGDPTPYFAKCSVSPDGKMPASIKPSMKTFVEELEKAHGKAAEGWQRKIV